MIIFESISFRNFLSTGNEPTVIQLNKHITTIMTGKNGGGKSTFEDALVYNLFGKPFRKVKLGQLINKVNEKELVTESNFVIGNKRYRVIRGQKPAVFEIWVDGIMIPQPAETKDYQHILENDILKLNYKTFTQIIILGSASFVPFMQLPLASRREIIENILDISVFTDMNEILKDKIKDLEAEIEDTKHKLELANTNYKLKFDFFQSVNRDNEKRVNDLEEKISELKKSILQATIKKDNLSKEVNEVQFIIDGFGNIESEKNAVGLNIMALQKDVSNKEYSLKSAIEANISYNELQRKIKEAEGELELSRGELDSNRVLSKAVDDGLLKYIDIDSIKTAAEGVVVRSKQIIKDREKSIKFFKDNNDCPSCGKHIDCDGSFESAALEKLENEIKDAEVNIFTNQTVIDGIIVQQAERDGLRNESIFYGKKITAFEQKVKMLESSLSIMNETIKSLVFTNPEEEQSVRDTIDKMKFDLTLLNKEVEDFNNKLNQLKEHKESLSKAKNSISLCEQIITSNESLIAGYAVDIDHIKNEPPSDITQGVLDLLIVDIKAFDTQLTKKKYLLHYYGVVKRLLKDDGIKTNIINQYLPVINATINMYLDKMDFPINFMFDDNFNEVIQSNYREEFSYHSFSEGEKARIDLALLFTWRDVALKKSRNAANILIFDEIFDGSLDADGIDNFMEILGVNKDGFSTFVISHKDETINARFDRNLVFTKDGHFSNMEEK